MGTNALRGTGVALITPFKDDGSIDYNAYQKLVENCIQGVDYLLVNGTTSESATTTKEEKLEVLSFIHSINKGRKRIVFGIGGNNTQELLSFISKMNFEGIDSVLSVSPYYNKPSQEGIFQHYKMLAEACPVPVILYNVPGRTASNIAAKTTIRLSSVPNIAGIKEASGNIEQALEIAKYVSPEFNLISGDDLITVPMISIGAQGVMSVLANAFPGKFSQMVQLALDNKFKEASEVAKYFVDLNPLLYEEGNPVGIKQVLEIQGVCTSNVRMPLSKASTDLRKKIEAVLKMM
ncbi:MAG: 4-hydroxy-tetrahydrodipicolinate synthase [Cytophagaceae bacterium]|jgi:4-hydroxy-tetrahydrodipicolinate synthase|nr:4-hydroxy-tetrahydrodipicolinate synthase [Cytophagaceae bacterium]